MMSSFRGYYEGLNNMTPTGVSQVIEAFVKLTFGLAATYVCFNKWIDTYHKEAVRPYAEVLAEFRAAYEEVQMREAEFRTLITR